MTDDEKSRFDSEMERRILPKIRDLPEGTEETEEFAEQIMAIREEVREIFADTLADFSQAFSSFLSFNASFDITVGGHDPGECAVIMATNLTRIQNEIFQQVLPQAYRHLMRGDEQANIGRILEQLKDDMGWDVTIVTGPLSELFRKPEDMEA